jgi:hypothetical protein
MNRAYSVARTTASVRAAAMATPFRAYPTQRHFGTEQRSESRCSFLG